jgi:hypothetical protein
VEVPLIKTRLESEEHNIKELQERITELSKKVFFLTFCSWAGINAIFSEAKRN